MFFQWFVAPEGRKIGSLKRRVRSHVARWEMKNCTPLWREAHFQVNVYKTHQVRSTFGSWDVEKVHAVVARSKFRSQNVQCTKHTRCGPLLAVEMSKKVHAAVARSTFPNQNVQSTPTSRHFWKLRCRKSARCCGAIQVKSVKKLTGTEHFWTFRCRFAWPAQGIVRLVKVSKTWGFSSISKNDGRRGTFEEDLERCIFRGRRSTRDMFIRRSGRWFPDRCCILEHQIFSFDQFWEGDSVWQVQHFVWPGITFSWQAQYVRDMDWKNGKTHWYEAVSSAISHYWRSLADLLRFWCCQLRKLRTSRRIALFLTLSSWKIVEVSQNCCVFNVVKFKNWGSLAYLFRFQAGR